MPTGASVSSQLPVDELQSETRHTADGAQVLGVPTQSPPLHAVARMHLSASAHARPFSLFVVAHEVPKGCVGSQTPTLQVPFEALQSFAGTEQVPVEQVPVDVLQPSPPHAPVVTVSSQLPVVLLQLGVLWHSRLMHFTVFAVSATHVPLWHLSFGVHASLSALQLAPSL